MAMADAELTALSMRGEYTLAYEAAMASRFINTIIAVDRVKYDLVTAQQREAILRIAQGMIENFGNARVEIALRRYAEQRDLFPTMQVDGLG